MRLVDVRLAGLAVAAAALAAAVSAAPAYAGSAVSSYAYGVSAGVASQGTATNLPDVAFTRGVGPKAYDRRALVPFASQSLGLVSNGKLTGEVVVTLAGIMTHAQSNGGSGATVLADADGAIGSAKMTVQLAPEAGQNDPAPPLLTLVIKKMSMTMRDEQKLPLVSVFKATASFGSLSLGGALFGATPLTFTGAAPGNTVLYEDPHITVTLNKQIVTGAIECTPTCQFVPKAMTADAVAIHINGAKVNGKPFFGNIVLGETQASIQ